MAASSSSVQGATTGWQPGIAYGCSARFSNLTTPNFGRIEGVRERRQAVGLVRLLRRVPATIAGLTDRPLRIALALVVLVILVSTVLLRFTYAPKGVSGSHLTVLDSLYFTVETISTVGFGTSTSRASRSGLRLTGCS